MSRWSYMDSKMNLSEEDIKLRCITPAIFDEAGWKKSDAFMEYSYTDCQINVINDFVKRDKKKRVDYLLLKTTNKSSNSLLSQLILWT